MGLNVQEVLKRVLISSYYSYLYRAIEEESYYVLNSTNTMERHLGDCLNEQKFQVNVDTLKEY